MARVEAQAGSTGSRVAWVEARAEVAGPRVPQVQARAETYEEQDQTQGGSRDRLAGRSQQGGKHPCQKQHDER
jgi:predicted NUDIX family NTP pyrophosphohydrolase